MTFYKTDIKQVPQTGNFEFKVKGLPSIKKEPFKSNIIFATSSVNFQRKGQQGPTLDKIFGSNFKRIKVPVQVPRGFSREARMKELPRSRSSKNSNDSSILEDDDESEFGIKESENESELNTGKGKRSPRKTLNKSKSKREELIK